MDVLRTALARWDDATAPDLHQFFGLNDMDPAFWDLPWRPLLSRIIALLTIPDSRLLRALDL